MPWEEATVEEKLESRKADEGTAVPLWVLVAEFLVVSEALWGSAHGLTLASL